MDMSLDQMADKKVDDKRSEKEIAERADAGLRALLKMPPKPHDEIAGKSKKKPTAKKKPARSR